MPARLGGMGSSYRQGFESPIRRTKLEGTPFLRDEGPQTDAMKAYAARVYHETDTCSEQLSSDTCIAGVRGWQLLLHGGGGGGSP